MFFTFHSRTFRLEAYARHLIKALEQGGAFLVPHLLLRGASDFTFSSEGPPPLSRLKRQPRDTEDLF